MSETVDPRGVRFTASITGVILTLALITESWRVMAAQTALFALCAFAGLKANPWGYVFRRTVRPRLTPIDPAEREDPAPVRFAQGVGLVFALLATIGYAAGWTVLGIGANVLTLAAVLLNAVFGYCLGCHMYLAIRRLDPTG
jgi:hypothetical protein